MIIESLHIKNFRSIYDENLTCENLTALIGPNGAGKSSFLKAIDFFYDPNANYTEQDFYNHNINNDIEIEITFTKLTNNEKEKFKKNCKDGKLTVKKEMRWPKGRGSQQYQLLTLENPDFSDFRDANGRADQNKEYNKLKEGKYSELPDCGTKSERLDALSEWEEKNLVKCSLKEGSWQDLTSKSGKTLLEEYTHFIYVPAVHDASEEASESAKSVFMQIMDAVVRSTLSQKEEFIKLEQTMKEGYINIMEHEKSSLNDLEKDINNTLGLYAPNSSVEIKWKPPIVNLDVPKANIKLIEDGYRSPVEMCGHGIQRAFIMSMFEQLEKIQSKIDKTENDEDSLGNIPNFIICIEEPEIYQHPNRQRYLSNIFLKLTEEQSENYGSKQIVYTTHSPLFVDLERFERIRKLDKIVMDSTQPKITRVNFTSFDKIVKLIEMAEGKEEGTFTVTGFKARIKAIMTPWMNEGFFADKIVLVEGIGDRAAILGLSDELKSSLDEDFEGNGISVIPCMGKNSLHQPYAIFSALNIPVYCIWDSDHGKYKNSAQQEKEIEKNHRLMSLCGHDLEDWPDKVYDNCACFKKNLNDTLKNEIDEPIYEEIIDKCCKDLEMDRKDAIKRPIVIDNLIRNAKKKGSSSQTLENIIEKILDLKHENVYVEYGTPNSLDPRDKQKIPEET